MTSRLERLDQRLARVETHLGMESGPWTRLERHEQRVRELEKTRSERGERLNRIEERIDAIGRLLTSQLNTTAKLEDWYNQQVKASNAKVRMSGTDEEIEGVPDGAVYPMPPVYWDDSTMIVVSDKLLLPWKEIRRRIGVYSRQEEEISSLRAKVKRLRVFENNLTREHLAQENLRLTRRLLDLRGCIEDAKKDLEQGSKT